LGLGSFPSEGDVEFLLASEALPESDLGSLESVEFFASLLSVPEAEASDESAAPEEESIGGVDFFFSSVPESEASDGREDPAEESIAVEFLFVSAAAFPVDPVESPSFSFESDCVPFMSPVGFAWVELLVDGLLESPPVPVKPPVAPVFLILLVASSSVSVITSVQS
jgi:hypothetical protein